MADPLVGDELAVGEGEGLEAGAVGRQLGQRGVRDQDAFLQVHALQLVAAPRQGLRKEELLVPGSSAAGCLAAPGPWACNKNWDWVPDSSAPVPVAAPD